MSTAALARPSRSLAPLATPFLPKLAMGLSGAVLLGYVLFHMLGNLQAFLGPALFNQYAHDVKSNLPLLTLVRVIPGAAVLVHVWAGLTLARRNRAARPVRYHRPQAPRAASRFMLFTGVVVLGFLVFHLLHFTLGTVQPQQFHRVNALGQHDAHAMLVEGLRNLPLALFYAVAQAALAVHLSHAATSVLRTLGLVLPGRDAHLRAVGPVFAGVVLAGNAALILGANLGWLR